MGSCPLQTCQVLAAARPAVDNALGIKHTSLHFTAPSSMSKYSSLTVQNMSLCIVLDCTTTMRCITVEIHHVLEQPELECTDPSCPISLTSSSVKVTS